MAKRSRRVPSRAKPIHPALPASDLLDLDQAIALLKTTRPTFYRWLRSGRVKGLKVGRQWRFRREDLDRFLAGESPRVDLPVSPQPLETALRERLGNPRLADEPADAMERIAMLMIRLAQARRATDLHILPLHVDDQPRAEVRLRIDGVLQPLVSFDIRLLGAVAAQWKKFTACDVREKRLPQEGRLLIRVDDAPLDIRVTFLPAHAGEAVTARIFGAGQIVGDLTHYITGRPLEILKRHLAAPAGMVIINGPTGSGKTTTLYACLKHLTNEHLKLVSIEDPVEYVLPGVLQLQLEPAAGVTFQRLLRMLLRSDCDVVMVGEVRDLETARLCMLCGMTGHRVLTTLHTNDSPSAVRRMRDLGVEPFVIGDALRLVVSQRLVRRLCPKCRVPATPSAEMLARAQAMLSGSSVSIDLSTSRFYEPAGCDECGRLGYRGRNAVYELLEMSPEIAAALRHDATERELREIAVRQGMVTLAADAIRLAAEGTTSLLEALHVSPID